MAAKRNSWVQLLGVLLRAWVPTWRFYDRPDLVIQVRAGAGSGFRPLFQSHRFRPWNLFLAPALVDQMWLESRVRGLVEQVREAGILSAEQYQELHEVLGRLHVRDGGGAWSLQARDAMDASLCLEIHGPSLGGIAR